MKTADLLMRPDQIPCWHVLVGGTLTSLSCLRHGSSFPDIISGYGFDAAVLTARLADVTVLCAWIPAHGGALLRWPGDRNREGPIHDVTDEQGEHELLVTCRFQPSVVSI